MAKSTEDLQALAVSFTAAELKKFIAEANKLNPNAVAEGLGVEGIDKLIDKKQSLIDKKKQKTAVEICEKMHQFDIDLAYLTDVYNKVPQEDKTQENKPKQDNKILFSYVNNAGQTVVKKVKGAMPNVYFADIQTINPATGKNFNIFDMVYVENKAEAMDYIMRNFMKNEATKAEHGITDAMYDAKMKELAIG